MILDNENKNKKVHEWISEYTEEGTFDIVTGYFTIGALAWLSNEVNEKISNFRMVLGDIVNFGTEEDRPLDLLNENKLNIVNMNIAKAVKKRYNLTNLDSKGEPKSLLILDYEEFE